MTGTGQKTKSLILQGREFDSARLPVSTSHMEGSGYLENYPPAFDVWVLNVQHLVKESFPANSVQWSLVERALETYESFRTFKHINDFERIQELLLQALESAGPNRERSSPPSASTESRPQLGESEIAPGAPSRESLEIRLQELENEQELSLAGLFKGSATAIGAMLSILATIGLSIISIAVTDRSVMTGTHIVILSALLLIGVLFYFSFVFRRRLELKAKIEETRGMSQNLLI